MSTAVTEEHRVSQKGARVAAIHREKGSFFGRHVAPKTRPRIKSVIDISDGSNSLNSSYSGNSLMGYNGNVRVSRVNQTVTMYTQGDSDSDESFGKQRTNRPLDNKLNFIENDHFNRNKNSNITAAQQEETSPFNALLSFYEKGKSVNSKPVTARRRTQADGYVVKSYSSDEVDEVEYVDPKQTTRFRSSKTGSTAGNSPRSSKYKYENRDADDSNYPQKTPRRVKRTSPKSSPRTPQSKNYARQNTKRDIPYENEYDSDGRKNSSKDLKDSSPKSNNYSRQNTKRYDSSYKIDYAVDNTRTGYGGELQFDENDDSHSDVSNDISSRRKDHAGHGTKRYDSFSKNDYSAGNNTTNKTRGNDTHVTRNLSYSSNTYGSNVYGNNTYGSNTYDKSTYGSNGNVYGSGNNTYGSNGNVYGIGNGAYGGSGNVHGSGNNAYRSNGNVNGIGNNAYRSNGNVYGSGANKHIYDNNIYRYSLNPHKLESNSSRAGNNRAHESKTYRDSSMTSEKLQKNDFVRNKRQTDVHSGNNNIIANKAYNDEKGNSQQSHVSYTNMVRSNNEGYANGYVKNTINNAYDINNTDQTYDNDNLQATGTNIHQYDYAAYANNDGGMPQNGTYEEANRIALHDAGQQTHTHDVGDDDGVGVDVRRSRICGFRDSFRPPQKREKPTLKTTSLPTQTTKIPTKSRGVAAFDVTATQTAVARKQASQSERNRYESANRMNLLVENIWLRKRGIQRA